MSGSVELTKPTRRRKQTAASKRSSSAAQRQRSPLAAAALKAFSSLTRFFGHDTELSVALGWDQATVAEWRARRVVRPQRTKMDAVAILLDLCEETRPYLRADTDVGRWVLAPLPNLQGATPSQWIQQRGRTGLRELIRGMVDSMPKVAAAQRKGRYESPDTTAIAEDERREGVEEFKRMLAAVQQSG